ncbi:hypothetical protein TUM20985_04790 [Mycobacterium antarcticum]|nr:hypothetical protein TUM20985_04790 [Mycolicibacterium sp. TUM20985]GLP73354.1 hypothetical protein TUM20983_04640 [Mycolicibacterium sp. TUM20983]GLP79068.1 hypothetical protein TUM20984_04880 [Mycolicibacterium sp. TUM20984]
MQNAGVIELGGEEHRELVGDLVGLQVMLDCEHSIHAAGTEPVRAQHVFTGVAEVRAVAARHANSDCVGHRHILPSKSVVE